jgi:hypothetical protein
MNDLQKIMAQLDRIEEHLRHVRYGETGQPSDYAQARELARIEDHVRHIRYGDRTDTASPAGSFNRPCNAKEQEHSNCDQHTKADIRDNHTRSRL